MADATREALILGREGGGLNGAPGGLCFYAGGKEYRVDPGDIVDLPERVYRSFLTDGLVEPTVPEPSTFGFSFEDDDADESEEDA